MPSRFFSVEKMLGSGLPSGMTFPVWYLSQLTLSMPDDELALLRVDQIINYRTERVADALKEKADVVLNPAPLPRAELTSLLGLLKSNGILVSTTGPADEQLAAELGVRTNTQIPHADSRREESGARR
jgi:hypothetical protein